MRGSTQKMQRGALSHCLVRDLAWGAKNSRARGGRARAPPTPAAPFIACGVRPQTLGGEDVDAAGGRPALRAGPNAAQPSAWRETYQAAADGRREAPRRHPAPQFATCPQHVGSKKAVPLDQSDEFRAGRRQGRPAGARTIAAPHTQREKSKKKKGPRRHHAQTPRAPAMADAVHDDAAIEDPA